MSKLLAYTIGGQKIGIDIKTWDTITLSGNTAFIVIADTGSTPSNYTNISSVENWNSFGNSAGLTDVQIRNEIVKLIPNIPTQAQYDILANYISVGINSMTKIGTSVSLGNIITGTTYLTGIKDIKLNITGNTATGNTIINGAIISQTVSGLTSVVSPNICATTSFFEGGTALSSKYASKASAITGATNLGTGNGSLYTIVSGNKINLKTLSGGTNVTITCNGNYVAINATSGGGGINWAGTTANGVGTYVSATCICSNPNMTFNGTALSITGNIQASTYICSPIITGSTCVTSPRVLGTTCVSAPITCGTSCVQTALLCSTGQVKGTIITGSTCVTSPITCGLTCVISPITIGSTCVCSPRILGSTSVCSPIITGSTCVTSPITCGLTRVQSPIVCGSTCVASPITCGTTCVISPITIGSTCVCSPVVLGSTSICSPTVCTSTCLCSTGTARFTGNVTAASTLNVSGNTRIVGITQCEIVFGNQTSCALTGNSSFLYNVTGCTLCVPFIKKTGSGSYFYTESLSKITEAAGTCKVYLSGTPWNFQAGTYRVDINANAGNGSSNGCTLVRVTCDGLGTAASIHGSDYLLRSQTANFGFSVSISRDMVFTAGCHCLIIQFWRGANTACITYGAIRAERIC